MELGSTNCHPFHHLLLLLPNPCCSRLLGLRGYDRAVVQGPRIFLESWSPGFLYPCCDAANLGKEVGMAGLRGGAAIGIPFLAKVSEGLWSSLRKASLTQNLVH